MSEWVGHHMPLLLFGCQVVCDSVTPWTIACQASHGSP